VALARLVPPALDGDAGEVAVPERPDPAVPDHRHVDVVHRQEVRERGGDAHLGVDGALPAPGARERVGEAGVGDALELVGRQEAGGGPVDLTGGRPHLDVESEMGGEDRRRVERLGLGAADDASDRGDPRLPEHRRRPRPAALAEVPLLDGHVGIDGDLGVGDVAKCDSLSLPGARAAGSPGAAADRSRVVNHPGPVEGSCVPLRVGVSGPPTRTSRQFENRRPAR
jgi:hypothetical protein